MLMKRLNGKFFVLRGWKFLFVSRSRPWIMWRGERNIKSRPQCAIRFLLLVVWLTPPARRARTEPGNFKLLNSFSLPTADMLSWDSGCKIINQNHYHTCFRSSQQPTTNAVRASRSTSDKWNRQTTSRHISHTHFCCISCSRSIPSLSPPPTSPGRLF